MSKAIIAAALATGAIGAPAMAAPVIWADNGHAYEYIGQGLTWDAARAAALASTYNGQHGYLVTVTSADEQAFVYGSVTNGTAWAGGSDAANEGAWSWVDGPEADTVFWQDGMTLTYANWSSGEPNNCCGGENYLYVNWSGDRWNDISGDSTTYGYIVEYGGLSGGIPEPAGWALFILGFGIVGGVLRRSRKVRVALTYA